MKVYAISGRARNGKDTVASMMADSLKSNGKSALIIHYADLLKYICRSYLGWNGKKDEDGRSILQYVGTEVVRRKAPDFWVDFVVSFLNIFDEQWDYVIIPDSRFPNEIDKLKNSGFNVQHLRVVRPGLVSELTPEQMNHPSETAMDNVCPDYTFINDGTLEGLNEQIKSYMEDYIYERS